MRGLLYLPSGRSDRPLGTRQGGRAPDRIVIVDMAPSLGGGERYIAVILGALYTRGADVVGAGPAGGGLERAIRRDAPGTPFHALPPVPPLAYGKRATLAFALYLPVLRRRLRRAIEALGPARIVLTMPAEQVLLDPAGTFWIVFTLAEGWRRSWPGILKRARRAKRIIAVSQATADSLEATGLAPCPVVRPPVLPPPPPPPRSSVGLDGVFEAAYVGRMEPEKGVGTLLEAASILLGRGIPPRLTMIGKGYRMAEYARSAQSGPLARYVRFLGEREDAPSLVGAFDLLIHPSPSESCPYAVIEAVAAGVPVVACAVGEIPWMAKEAAGAIRLVPPGDAPALADAWAAAAAEVAALRRCAREASAHLLDLLSPSRAAEAFERALSP